MAAASGPSLVLGLAMMSLLMMLAYKLHTRQVTCLCARMFRWRKMRDTIRTLPKAAVSYAEVGFAVEKSALRPAR